MLKHNQFEFRLSATEVEYYLQTRSAYVIGSLFLSFFSQSSIIERHLSVGYMLPLLQVVQPDSRCKDNSGGSTVAAAEGRSRGGGGGGGHGGELESA